MLKIKSIEIRCLNPDCKKWFKSPIFIDKLDTLTSINTKLIGNTAECPHCNEMTPCNKENMRARAKGGGFIGMYT